MRESGHDKCSYFAVGMTSEVGDSDPFARTRFTVRVCRNDGGNLNWLMRSRCDSRDKLRLGDRLKMDRKRPDAQEPREIIDT